MYRNQSAGNFCTFLFFSMKPATCLRVMIIGEWLIFVSGYLLFFREVPVGPFGIVAAGLMVAGTVGLFLLIRKAVYLYMISKLVRVLALGRIVGLGESIWFEIHEVASWFIFGCVVFLVFACHATKPKSAG